MLILQNWNDNVYIFWTELARYILQLLIRGSHDDASEAWNSLLYTEFTEEIFIATSYLSSAWLIPEFDRGPENVVSAGLLNLLGCRRLQSFDPAARAGTVSMQRQITSL